MYIPAPEHLQSPRSPAVLPACACTEGGENGRKILSLALPFPSLQLRSQKQAPKEVFHPSFTPN